MRCHGGFSLDETTRRSWYNPEAILSDLHAGMVFADIGCGDGFFSILAAKKVGASGKVYAVDIDPSAVRKLQAQAAKQGLNNINAVVGKAEDTVFCRGCVDLVFYSMNLHDFNDAGKVLANARLMVKADGELVDLDWEKKQMPFGPPEAIRFSGKKASELINSAGFRVKSVNAAGPYHYVVIAKPV
ncbi:MAG: class I SAM-dependent methyltransferase [Candidatus Bathyarchaeota archaeon]|nr:class I SAM-dependent methyltransferase [Candidatus Bathyarchaeota archaeon]